MKGSKVDRKLKGKMMSQPDRLLASARHYIEPDVGTIEAAFPVVHRGPMALLMGAMFSVPVTVGVATYLATGDADRASFWFQGAMFVGVAVMLLMRPRLVERGLVVVTASEYVLVRLPGANLERASEAERISRSTPMPAVTIIQNRGASAIAGGPLPFSTKTSTFLSWHFAGQVDPKRTYNMEGLLRSLVADSARRCQLPSELESPGQQAYIDRDRYFDATRWFHEQAGDEVVEAFPVRPIMHGPSWMNRSDQKSLHTVLITLDEFLLVQHSLNFRSPQLVAAADREGNDLTSSLTELDFEPEQGVSWVSDLVKATRTPRPQDAPTGRPQDRPRTIVSSDW